MKISLFSAILFYPKLNINFENLRKEETEEIILSLRSSPEIFLKLKKDETKIRI